MAKKRVRTKEERLAIGRRICKKELNLEQAAVAYGISPYTARSYYRLYKATRSAEAPKNEKNRTDDERKDSVMVNHITLMGRLTRDPELRHTSTGTAVVSFSLAVDRRYKDKETGERDTDFIDCVAWRQTGLFVSKYFTKGRMAVVEGTLQMRNWQDKDGNKRRSAEVVVENICFADSRKPEPSDAETGDFMPEPEDPELPF